MAPKSKKPVEKKEAPKPEAKIEEESKEEVKAEKNSVDTTDSIRKVAKVQTQAVEASKEAVEHQLDEYKDKLGNTIDQSKKAEQETTEEDPDSKSVWVKNVDYSAKAEELAEHFADCGTISRVTIPVDKFNNNYPLGYAYIEFSDKDGQQKALNLHQSLFKGRQLTVQEKRKNVPFRGRYRMSRGGAFNPLMAMYAMRSFGMMPGMRRSRGNHYRGY